MKWKAQFFGRLKGAIGMCYWFEVVVDAPDGDAARLKLYDTHEHVDHLTVVLLTNQ